MKRAALLLLFVAAACQSASDRDQNPYAGNPDAVQAGAKLFHQHCAECHGADARGRGAAPDLHNPWVHDSREGTLFAFITNGRIRRGMPSWSRLPPERRWQIVTYLRSLEPAAETGGSSNVVRSSTAIPR